ncbi:MAG: flagellin [Planctomycetota bacterium]
MSLTITNVNTLSLLNILNKTSAAQSLSLTRLSTGQRINSGADDPAGLIALNSINRELTSVDAAISNNQRTDAMLSVADGALSEISTLLGDIQSLAAASSNSAGLTASELAANQSQIDNALASVERIVRTTEFNGKKLLDGSQGINVTGVTAANITDVRVYSRDPNASSSTIRVNVNSIATRANTAAANALATNSASEATTIEIKGTLGTQIIEVAANENLSSITAKINDVAALTGVYASQAGGVATAAVHMRTSGYGSDEFVKVSILEGGAQNGSGTFNTANVTGTDAGVSINGHTAATDGKEVFYNSGSLSLTFKITDAFTAGSSDTFTVDSSGGMTFQLGTDSTMRATLGVDSLFSQRLGTGTTGEVLSALKSGGTYDLNSNPSKAVEIVRAAREQVATLQGRLGGFQKYQVQTSLNAMTSSKENLTAVKSIIGDVDYATETAELSRQNVLMQSAISLLGLANQQSAQVLSLL